MILTRRLDAYTDRQFSSAPPPKREGSRHVSSADRDRTTSPNPQAVATLRRLLLRGTGCAIAAMLVLTLMPMLGHLAMFVLMLLVLTLGVGGVWFAVQARRYAKKIGLRPVNTAITFGISVLSIGIAVLIMIGLAAVPQFREFTECLRGANTTTARQHCDDQIPSWTVR